MAVTVGGMRHISTAAGLVDQVCGELKNLDEQALNEVLNFIYKKKSSLSQAPPEMIGTVEPIHKHVGKWSFNEGERAKLTQEILSLREGVR
jgi:hypothetical protein